MKKYSIILIALFAVLSTLQAQVDRSKAPKPGPAPVIRIGAYTRFELPNGLKVFVVENHRIPRVSYSISLIMNPPLEGEDAGVSSLTGQLLGTGTKTRTKDQIDEGIDFIGATLSGSAESIYASSLKKHTEKLLDILSDVAINSAFNSQEFEKRRTQYLSGLASSKDDPNSISSNVSSAIMFGKNHPYGEFATETSVRKITLDMCNQYYNTWFRPNIAYLSIVGDITPAEAKKLVEKYFSKWQKAPVNMPTYAKPTAPDKTVVEIVDRPQSVQSVIDICYPVDIMRGNPDYIKLQVANTILGGGIFRLFTNLREKHAYTYGAYSSIAFQPLISSFEATTSVRNAVTDSAVYQMLYEMKRLQNEPVPADELDMARNYMTGTFSLSLENPQTIATFAINTERYGLPKDYYTNYLKNIALVSANDVQSVAKKYILPGHANIVVVGKASDIASTLEQFSADGKVKYYDVDGNPYDPTKAKMVVPEGVTAQMVLDKYIQAVGGMDNISKIKDITMKGSFSMQGMALEMTMMYKIPGKYLNEIVMNGQSVQKQVLNGDSGRSYGMQGTKDINGDELEKLKMEGLLFPEFEYAKNGYTVELKEMTKIDGQDAYALVITSPGKQVTTDYYSVETGLKLRTISTSETPMGQVTSQGDILEYTDVLGVKFPKKIKQTMGPQSFEITVNSIQANTGLSDDLFNLN